MTTLQLISESWGQMRMQLLSLAMAAGVCLPPAATAHVAAPHAAAIPQ